MRAGTTAAWTCGPPAASWPSCWAGCRCCQAKPTWTSWLRRASLRRRSAARLLTALLLLAQIYQLLGAPHADELCWLREQPDFGTVTFSCQRHVPLAELLPDAPPRATQLASRLLRFASPARPSAAQALEDDWFMRLPLPLPRADLRSVLL